MEIQALQKSYNELLESMENFKNELEKNGFEIKNGNILQKPLINYYMEVAIIGETQDEDSGHYKMFREFIPIKGDLLSETLEVDRIKGRNREQAIKDFVMQLIARDSETEYECLVNCLDAIEDVNGYLISEESEIDYIDCGDSNHDELLFEAYLKSSYDNWHGYISFIKYDKDLTKHNINFEFSKFFRPNHEWRE